MKFNPLLDSFPTEYMGYKMNTDFRVGILLTKLFNSGKFTDEEKKIQALKIAYKKMELSKFKDILNFDEYREIYPLELQHGLMKIKYMLVKYHLEKVLLLFGPVFLKIVRGE